MKIVNDVVFFLCELAALTALAVWGWRAGSGAWSWVLLIAAPVAFAVAWGFLAAPTSATRLADPWLLVFQLAAFLVAAFALFTVDLTGWAIALAVVGVLVVALDRVLT